MATIGDGLVRLARYNEVLKYTYCIADKTASEGSSSTYIQFLTQVNTSATAARLDVWNIICLQNTK